MGIGRKLGRHSGYCELSREGLRRRDPEKKGDLREREAQKCLSACEGEEAPLTCLFVKYQRKTTKLPLIDGSRRG